MNRNRKRRDGRGCQLKTGRDAANRKLSAQLDPVGASFLACPCGFQILGTQFKNKVFHMRFGEESILCGMFPAASFLISK
jgi:hypothetical protein